MPRIRSIKPEIIEDEKTGPLSDTAFRLFASMIFLADDHGNVRADVRWLQAQIWWAHSEPPNVLSALMALSRDGLIDVYGVRGGTYAHLRGWEKHQRIDNAGKNRVPIPKDPDSQEVQWEDAVDKYVSRRNSANLGEIPLDQDPDKDPEREMDKEPAASRRVRKSKPPQRPSVSLPTDWSPHAEMRGKVVELGLNYTSEVEHFRDHHTARATRFADWDAAFRTWLRNAVKFGRATKGGKTTLDLQLERVAMLEEQERQP